MTTIDTVRTLQSERTEPYTPEGDAPQFYAPMRRPVWTMAGIRNREANCELDNIDPESDEAIERYGAPTATDLVLAQQWERWLLSDAPNGWTTCHCGYERPVGAACGEPCA